MNQAPLDQLRDWRAQTAIILGSGLNTLVKDVDPNRAIDYKNFPEIPPPSVPGHTGRFVLSEIGGTPVIFAQGRSHLYEGHTAKAITAGVRLLAEAGIKQLILTNAAGSVNPKFPPGDWMMITDHINLTGQSPLTGSPRFLDLTEVYSKKIRERFAAAARNIDMLLHEGVYVALPGPQYETPAEVRMMQKLGADAVGMSTVLEAIQARALGLEVAGFSCITNLAAGISKTHLSHEEVLETGKGAADIFRRLLLNGLV